MGAIYAYGGSEEDITGVIELNIDEGCYRIIKELDNSLVYHRSIQRLLGKCFKDFNKGIFKENIGFPSY